MPLTDYTFRLGDTGVVLNDDALSLPFVDIDEIRGLDSAPYRETTRDHEGVDGGFMDAEFERARPIVLVGTVYADPNNMENYLDSLKENYAPSQTLIPFYLKATGVSERVMFVKPQGARYDWDSNRRLGTARIQFLVYAEDPRIYTNTLQNIDAGLGGIATDGFGFPLDFPFGFGVTNEVSNAVTLTNSGNRPAPIDFTIFGPVTNPRIINETIGETLQFNIVLGATDTLAISTYYRTVRLNGNINRRNSLVEANWFDLNKGNTTIRYQAGAVNTSIFDPNALNANPFFETDVSDWTVTGGTFVKSTTKFHEGVASGLLTPDGVTAIVNAHTTHVPVKAGTTYKPTAWLNCDVSRSVNIQILWFNAALALLSTSTLSVALTANTWTLPDTSFLAPANTEFAQLQIEMTGTPLVSHLLYIDEAKILKPMESKLNVQFRSAWR